MIARPRRISTTPPAQLPPPFTGHAPRSFMPHQWRTAGQPPRMYAEKRAMATSRRRSWASVSTARLLDACACSRGDLAGDRDPAQDEHQEDAEDEDAERVAVHVEDARPRVRERGVAAVDRVGFAGGDDVPAAVADVGGHEHFRAAAARALVAVEARIGRVEDADAHLAPRPRGAVPGERGEAGRVRVGALVEDLGEAAGVLDDDEERCEPERGGEDLLDGRAHYAPPTSDSCTAKRRAPAFGVIELGRLTITF